MDTATDVDTPDRVKVPVVTPAMLTSSTPVALARPRVAAAVALTFTTSIPVMEVGVTDAVKAALRISSPVPPARRSRVLRVCTPEVVRAPSKESSPVVPVKLFALVVSGRIQIFVTY